MIYMPKKKIKLPKIIGISLIIVMLLVVSCFFIYVNDYYKAEPEALALITDTNVSHNGNLYVLNSEKESDIGFIFYPGAKVEAVAYLPLLKALSLQGVHCVLVEMPFNLAIFDINAANKVYDQLPNVKHWYIGGHSLGGAMASSYAQGNPAAISGLILLGAYRYGTYPSTSTLTIYGSLNDEVEAKLNYTENIVKIEGGNHAQFGNYGQQKGDDQALITTDEQQKQTIEAIVDFIKKSKK